MVRFRVWVGCSEEEGGGKEGFRRVVRDGGREFGNGAAVDKDIEVWVLFSDVLEVGDEGREFHS